MIDFICYVIYRLIHKNYIQDWSKYYYFESMLLRCICVKQLQNIGYTSFLCYFFEDKKWIKEFQQQIILILLLLLKSLVIGDEMCQSVSDLKRVINLVTILSSSAKLTMIIRSIWKFIWFADAVCLFWYIKSRKSSVF